MIIFTYRKTVWLIFTYKAIVKILNTVYRATVAIYTSQNIKTSPRQRTKISDFLSRARAKYERNSLITLYSLFNHSLLTLYYTL